MLIGGLKVKLLCEKWPFTVTVDAYLFIYFLTTLFIGQYVSDI